MISKLHWLDHTQHLVDQGQIEQALAMIDDLSQKDDGIKKQMKEWVKRAEDRLEQE